MTLERVRDDPESFYNGALASDIIRDLKKVNGMVTDSDLRNYRPITRNPYQRGLSGMKMYLTPPPTSGAVLGLILNILQGRSSPQNAIIIIVIIIVFLHLTRLLKNTVINIAHVAHIAPLPCAHTLLHIKKKKKWPALNYRLGREGGVENFYCVTLKFTGSPVTLLWPPPVSPFKDLAYVKREEIVFLVGASYVWIHWQSHFHRLHPHISMHILHTVLCTFPKVLTRRIWLAM